MENFIELVKRPTPMSVQGYEALSIGENFNLFFKEFSTSIDKRMAMLSKSIHPVELQLVQAHIRGANVLYVKNTAAEILTPEGYAPGLGNMMAHTKGVVEGVYVIASLKTEASRLYDWLKQIIRNGRCDSSFRWTVGDFGNAVIKAENFIRNIPDASRSVKYTLGQVYVSFEEYFDVVNTFNTTVRTLGARDVEMIAKDLSNVYDLGQLLVKKIQANDIRLTEQSVTDIESIVNKFIELTNISGALMVLLNELTAVLTAQGDAIKQLR